MRFNDVLVRFFNCVSISRCPLCIHLKLHQRIFIHNNFYNQRDSTQIVRLAREKKNTNKDCKAKQRIWKNNTFHRKKCYKRVFYLLWKDRRPKKNDPVKIPRYPVSVLINKIRQGINGNESLIKNKSFVFCLFSYFN